MKKHHVKIVKISNTIEEEVTLILKKCTLTCFIAYYPYEIEEKKAYLATFDLTIGDDYIVEELCKQEYGFDRIGNGFGYWVKGLFRNGILYSVIPFEEKWLTEEFNYLNDKFVRLKVDRIDVSFFD